MVCAVNRLPIISGYVTARRPRSDMEKPDILVDHVDGGLGFSEGKCFNLRNVDFYAGSRHYSG